MYVNLYLFLVTLLLVPHNFSTPLFYPQLTTRLVNRLLQSSPKELTPPTTPASPFTPLPSPALTGTSRIKSLRLSAGGTVPGSPLGEPVDDGVRDGTATAENAAAAAAAAAPMSPVIASSHTASVETTGTLGNVSPKRGRGSAVSAPAINALAEASASASCVTQSLSADLPAPHSPETAEQVCPADPPKYFSRLPSPLWQTSLDLKKKKKKHHLALN